MRRKYIFVVGGVMSGVGKGVASSSIGAIMQARGWRVTAIKIDPYINVDAGTMNPTEHGEVFVLGDGDETDQDMGNYERFLDTDLSSMNYMTTGRVYQEVIRKERNLEYKGRNVEVVPDIPLEVIRRIEAVAHGARAEVTLVEIGGTVGEYQNIIFLEAARMMKSRAPKDVAFVMVSYVPLPSKIGEMKTKPTQYAARTLNSAGVQADIIIARSERALDLKRKEKIALFCNIPAEQVVSAPDVESIYDVPLNFEKDHIGDTLSRVLGLPRRTADMSRWKKLSRAAHSAEKTVRIAVVGKYFDSGDFVLSDVYISVLEALKAAAHSERLKLEIGCVNAKDFEKNPASVSRLDAYDGILVPGGFGEKGVEGIIMAIKRAREKRIPYLGLCYGMQLAVIEFARSVCGLKGAHTTEVDPRTPYPVIHTMEAQKNHIKTGNYGGTMRLGSYKAALKKGSVAAHAYGTGEVIERHRHRYEVNQDFVPVIEEAGLVFSGKSPDGKLCEIAELPRTEHPFFIGTQFHPEFTSRPHRPHPLFRMFIRTAAG